MTTPDLDRFQAIFKAWKVEKAEISPDFDENRPNDYLLADVWLDDKELGDLEARAEKNGGEVVAKHSRIR